MQAMQSVSARHIRFLIFTDPVSDAAVTSTFVMTTIAFQLIQWYLPQLEELYATVYVRTPPPHENEFIRQNPPPPPLQYLRSIGLAFAMDSELRYQCTRRRIECVSLWNQDPDLENDALLDAMVDAYCAHITCFPMASWTKWLVRYAHTATSVCLAVNGLYSSRIPSPFACVFLPLHGLLNLSIFRWETGNVFSAEWEPETMDAVLQCSALEQFFVGSKDLTPRELDQITHSDFGKNRMTHTIWPSIRITDVHSSSLEGMIAIRHLKLLLDIERPVFLQSHRNLIDLTLVGYCSVDHPTTIIDAAALADALMQCTQLRSVAFRSIPLTSGQLERLCSAWTCLVDLACADMFDLTSLAFLQHTRHTLQKLIVDRCTKLQIPDELDHVLVLSQLHTLEWIDMIAPNERQLTQFRRVPLRDDNDGAVRMPYLETFVYKNEEEEIMHSPH